MVNILNTICNRDWFADCSLDLTLIVSFWKIAFLVCCWKQIIISRSWNWTHLQFSTQCSNGCQCVLCYCTLLREAAFFETHCINSSTWTSCFILQLYSHIISCSPYSHCLRLNLLLLTFTLWVPEVDLEMRTAKSISSANLILLTLWPWIHTSVSTNFMASCTVASSERLNKYYCVI